MMPHIESIGINSMPIPPIDAMQREGTDCSKQSVEIMQSLGLSGFGILEGGGHFSQLSELIKEEDHEALSTFLSEHGVKVDITPKVGCSELHYSKFNVANSEGEAGDSLLIVAARTSSDMVRAILDYGGNPNHTNRAGDSPLSIAAVRGDRKSIDMLLMAGANLAAAVIKLTSALRMQDDESAFSTRPLVNLLTISTYLQCRDPFRTAFDVRKSIVEVVNVRSEFKTDLAELIKTADKFTFELLNCCELMSEARLVLSVSAGLLESAVVRKNKIFVSHPFSQQVIREAWKKDLLNKRSYFLLALKWIFSPLLLPIYLCLLPCERGDKRRSVLDTRFGRHMSFLLTPMLCYVADIVNYFIFLLSVFMVTFLGMGTNIVGGFGVMELVLLFAVSRLALDADQLCHQGWKRYFSNFWNIVDCALSCVFLLSVVVYDVGYWKEPRRSYRPLILDAAYMFGLAEFFLVLRWLYFLEISSSETLGPLIISMKYLLVDVFQFVIVVMLTCALSAATAIFTILSTVENRELMGNRTEEKPERFGDFRGTFVTIVWSTFGIYDYNDLTMTENSPTDFFTKLIMLLYLAISCIIMLNILIAMLNNTYERIQENCDLEWKFTQSELLKEYRHGQPFIFPFSLFLFPVTWWFRRLLEQARATSRKVSVNETYQRAVLLQRLCDRYGGRSPENSGNPDRNNCPNCVGRQSRSSLR